jgi:hypothetical protein
MRNIHFNRAPRCPALRESSPAVLLAVLIACGGGGSGRNTDGGDPRPAPGPDSTAPSTPGAVTAAAISATRIDVGWAASTDQVGVAGYHVYRGGSRHQDIAAPPFSDERLAPATRYCYAVSAFDAAGNESARSADQCATTLPAPAATCTLTVAPPASGKVTGTGIDCGSDCTEAYPAGTSVTLTGNPASPIAVTARWTGCDASSGNECTVQMTADRSVSVAFESDSTPRYEIASLPALSPGSYTVSWACVSAICSTTIVLQEAADTSFASPQTYTFISGEKSKAFTGKAAGTWCYRAGTPPGPWSAAKCTTVTVICSAGQTRCVAGEIGSVDTCDALRTGWTRSSCGSLSLCSRDACRAACDMVTAPTVPTLCVVPNKDGKNDGEFALWTDGKLAPVTYTLAGAVKGDNTPAPIYLSGENWPYAWSVDSASVAYVQFKLNQFGGTRKQRLVWRARRAGILNQNLNRYLVGVFNKTTSIASCLISPVSYAWEVQGCLNGAPYNAQLDYAGGWNAMLLSITGDGFGGTIDLLDVNYLKLSIEP